MTKRTPRSFWKRVVPQWCSTAEAYFVSACTVVLCARRILVQVYVDAVVDVSVTQLPCQDDKA